MRCSADRGADEVGLYDGSAGAVPVLYRRGEGMLQMDQKHRVQAVWQRR